MIGYARQIQNAVDGQKIASTVPGSLFWKAEDFGVSGVSFDLLINETHGFEFDVSEYAIENGETVADNVRRRLRKVTIVGLFTNSPIGGGSQEGDRIIAAGKTATLNRALEQWDALKEVASARQAVQLVSALETYEEMVITSLRAARGPEDGEAIKFEMELTEVKSVSLARPSYDSGTYTPKKQDDPKTRAMAKEKKNGNVSAQDKKAEEMARELASANEGTLGG